MRYVILALIASCAVAPAESSVDQSACRRDPVTGHCPTLTAEDAGERTVEWVQANYADPLTLDLGCREIRGLDGKLQGYECEISFEWGGNWHQASCAVWTSGSVDCGEDE